MLIDSHTNEDNKGKKTHFPLEQNSGFCKTFKRVK